MTARRTWPERWHAAPPGEEAEARHLRPERMVRDYGSVKTYQRDAAMLAKEGWQVTSVQERRATGGLVRIVVGSWLRGRRRARPDLVVSYRRHH